MPLIAEITSNITQKNSENYSHVSTFLFNKQNLGNVTDILNVVYRFRLKSPQCFGEWIYFQLQEKRKKGTLSYYPKDCGNLSLR